MKIELIEWRDSEAGGGRAWTDAEEVKEWANEPVKTCFTVGFLVDETDAAITLAFGHHNGGEYGAHIKIPVENVVSRVVLNRIDSTEGALP